MKRVHDGLVTVAFTIVLLLGGAGGSAAQQPILSDPASVARCLCLQSLLDRRKAESDLAVGQVERSKAELRSLEETLDYERGRVDVANDEEVQRFRRRVADLADLRLRLEETQFPAALAATDRYSAARNSFVPLCTTRPWAPQVVAAVRRNLVCPPE